MGSLQPKPRWDSVAENLGTNREEHCSVKRRSNSSVPEGTGLGLDEALSSYKYGPNKLHFSCDSAPRNPSWEATCCAHHPGKTRRREILGTTGQDRVSRPTRVTELLPQNLVFNSQQQIRWPGTLMVCSATRRNLGLYLEEN